MLFNQTNFRIKNLIGGAMPLSMRWRLPERSLLMAKMGLPNFTAQSTACMVPDSFSQATTITLSAIAIWSRVRAMSRVGLALVPSGYSETIMPPFWSMANSSSAFSLG